MYIHPPKAAPNPLLYVGFLITAVGAGMVLYFKTAGVGHGTRIMRICSRTRIYSRNADYADPIVKIRLIRVSSKTRVIPRLTIPRPRLIRRLVS